MSGHYAGRPPGAEGAVVWINRAGQINTDHSSRYGRQSDRTPTWWLNPGLYLATFGEAYRCDLLDVEPSFPVQSWELGDTADEVAA